MRKMKKSVAVRLVATALCVGVAGVASAEVDPAITAIVTSATTTITGIITAVLAAGGTILLAALGLKALPYAYRKIVGFFQ